MAEDLEAILRRVAAGELTPDEALPLLGQDDAARPTSPVPSGTPATSVRLRTSYRSVEIVVDPGVASLHAVGEHWIEQNGDTLLVGTPGPLDEEGADRGAAGRFSFSSLPKTIAWARAWRDHRLTLHVNPALRLDLDVTGADIKLTGAPAALRGRLAASSLKAERLDGPIDLDLTSSSLKLKARPTGESRIHAESSSVRLTLPGDADLTIVASQRMSSLNLLDQANSSFALETDRAEARIGEGRHRLVLDAVMSSVNVTAQTWDTWSSASDRVRP